LFKRNYDGDRLVIDEVTPGCEWVLAGEGVATIKWDGTACLVQNGVLYKRYDAKKGKTPPPDFIPAQDEPDPITGHFPGWVPVSTRPEDKYHLEAWTSLWEILPNGTYELVGPKVQGNPYNLHHHELWRHGLGRSILVEQPPRTFEGLRQWLADHTQEGIVWHHADGRMSKIKRRDFGLPWP
jgi:hypothetical protein